MTKVQDMATITLPGGETKLTDSLSSRAYLVWLSARNSTKAVNGLNAGGVAYNGSLKSIVLDLWPELSPSYRRDELDMFCREVYAYLRATNNAICTNKGSSRGVGVSWWIADSWKQPDGPVVIRFTAAHKATAAENKLTPKEAGEDRAPAPVTVIHTEITNDDKDNDMTATAPASEAPTQNTMEAHRQKMRERHADILALCEMSVANAAEPITAAEVTFDVGTHESTTRKTLTELVDAGKLFSRTETREERAIRFGGSSVASAPSALYWAKSPVPERTKRVVIKGFQATSTRNPSGAQKRGVNDALMLSATRVGQWETIGTIGTRARVPQGSRTMSMARLVEQGLVKAKRDGHVVRYRKRSGAAPEQLKPEKTVVAPPPLAVIVVESTARQRAVEAVESLISELGDSSEVEALRSELAAARARIAELEAALEPLQALMNRG